MTQKRRSEAGGRRPGRPARLRRHGLMLLLAAITAAAPAGAQTREAIRYTLRFPAPQTNYVEVEALVPTDGRPSVDLMMAVWTPGSYLIREHERNLAAVQAPAGTRVLPAGQTVNNR